MEILFSESDSLESSNFMEPADDLQEISEQRTTWSMEILPHNIADVPLIPECINEVYITMIPGAHCWETIQTAQQIQAVGKHAVPHIAARSFAGVEELEACLSGLQEAGIERALLIGGGNSELAGEFSCVMDILKTGLLAKYGINALDFAGHPEGNPDDPNSEFHLLEKLRWTEERGIPARIITQWCLDTDGANAWISGLREKGICNPIHIGIPGPSTIKTLMRFAKVCGVKASTKILRKQGLNLSKLMFVNKPDKIISGLRGYDQLHLYPFGGLEKSAAWLTEWQRNNL
ncbi:MAG: methylenetetrahydrofolate reductase [SAR324 cluster bacterium]|jgi:methylenetetrahydrofolate reductase (NADPH)|nr:methylenetetrahydrofolate reductase [SAR324 cluster bacterium]MCH2264931.1 methylenetetrahydrofolate reductase [SAR324 cluster bacterium]